MKNAAGKQHIHLHIHTYALRRNALHAIALETELSCEIQTQKYILKLKCDCLSKCKQSKGCAGLTHTHSISHMHIPYTDTQCTGNKCIFVHLADTQRVAPLWVGVASFGERRTQCIIKKAFFSITHFPGTSRAQQIDI